MKATKNHTRFAALDQPRADELKRKEEKEMTNSTLARPCSSHECKEIESFCEDCSQPICSACAMLTHRSHTRCSFNEAALKCKATMKEIMCESKAHLQQLQESIKVVSETHINVKTKSKLIADQINEEFSELHKQIDERKSMLLKELQALTFQKLHCLSIEKQRLESMYRKVGRSYGMAEGALSSESHDCEFVMAKHQLVERLRTAIQKRRYQHQQILQTVTHNDDDSFKYDPCPSRDDHHQQQAQSHKVEDNETGQQQCKLTRMIEDYGRIVDLKEANGVHSKAEKVKKKKKARRQVGEEKGERRSDYSKVNEPQFVFGSKGSSNGQFQSPCGVTVNLQGDIIVADRHNTCVQVFNCNGDFLFAFGSRGTSNGQFQDPYGVAVDNSKEGHIVVVDRSNHCVQVFNCKGDFLRAFGSYGSSNGQFQYPCGVAVNKEGHVIVADHGNHRVQVFTAKGKFLHTFGSNGSADGQFQDLWGVAVDNKEGHIIVTDRFNNNVQVFDCQGAFLYAFGSQGSSNGQFKHPCGVAVDSDNSKEGHIIVADTGNHRVQVFNCKGEFCHAFGSHGAADNGQFDGPCSVAVDSKKGHIIVADYGNHRVQVF